MVHTTFCCLINRTFEVASYSSADCDNMGQLDSLPRELLYLILEHCSFDDCKNLRATCRYISGLTNPRVFQTYCIAFFQSHLERFVVLSSRPDIARCIKRLVFVGDVLPQMDWVGTFEGLIDMREPWSLFSKKYIEVRSRTWFHKNILMTLPGTNYCRPSTYGQPPIFR